MTYVEEILAKKEALSTAKTNKVIGLAGKLQSGMITGMQDADTQTTSVYDRDVRDVTATGQYHDSAETFHNGNKQLFFGNNTEKRRMQEEATKDWIAKSTGVRPTTVTDKDIAELGQFQLVKKLYDVSRDKNQDPNWMPKYEDIHGAERLNVSGHYKDAAGKAYDLPLNIPTQVLSDGSKVSGSDRYAGQIINPNTGVNVSATTAQNPALNTQYSKWQRGTSPTNPSTPTVNSGKVYDSRGFLEKGIDVGKSFIGGMYKNVVLDTIDLVGDTTGVKALQLGDAEHKQALADKVIGGDKFYRDQYSKVLESRVQDMKTNGVTLGKVADAVWEQTGNSDALGTSAAFIASLVLPGTAVSKAGGAVTAVGKAEKAAKEAYVVAGKTPEAKAAYQATMAEIKAEATLSSGLKQLVGSTAANGGKFTAGEKIAGAAAKESSILPMVATMTNDQVDEFKANNNGQNPTAGDIARMTAINTVMVGMEKWVDIGILKDRNAVDGIKKVLGAVGDRAAVPLASEVAKTALGIGMNMGKEAGQEYLQQMSQLFNQQYHTSKGGSEAWKILSDTANNWEAASAAIAGAAGGLQFQGVGSATQAHTLVKPTYEAVKKGVFGVQGEVAPIVGDSGNAAPEAVGEAPVGPIDEFKTTEAGTVDVGATIKGKFPSGATLSQMEDAIAQTVEAGHEVDAQDAATIETLRDVTGGSAKQVKEAIINGNVQALLHKSLAKDESIPVGNTESEVRATLQNDLTEEQHTALTAKRDQLISKSQEAMDSGNEVSANMYKRAADMIDSKVNMSKYHNTNKALLQEIETSSVDEVLGKLEQSGALGTDQKSIDSNKKKLVMTLSHAVEEGTRSKEYGKAYKSAKDKLKQYAAKNYDSVEEESTVGARGANTYASVLNRLGAIDSSSKEFGNALKSAKNWATTNTTSLKELQALKKEIETLSGQKVTEKINTTTKTIKNKQFAVHMSNVDGKWVPNKASMEMLDKLIAAKETTANTLKEALNSKYVAEYNKRNYKDGIIVPTKGGKSDQAAKADVVMDRFEDNGVTKVVTNNADMIELNEDTANIGNYNENDTVGLYLDIAAKSGPKAKGLVAKNGMFAISADYKGEHEGSYAIGAELKAAAKAKAKILLPIRSYRGGTDKKSNKRNVYGELIKTLRILGYKEVNSTGLFVVKGEEYDALQAKALKDTADKVAKKEADSKTAKSSAIKLVLSDEDTTEVITPKVRKLANEYELELAALAAALAARDSEDVPTPSQFELIEKYTKESLSEEEQALYDEAVVRAGKASESANEVIKQIKELQKIAAKDGVSVEEVEGLKKEQRSLLNGAAIKNVLNSAKAVVNGVVSPSNTDKVFAKVTKDKDGKETKVVESLDVSNMVTTMGTGTVLGTVEVRELGGTAALYLAAALQSLRSSAGELMIEPLGKFTEHTKMFGSVAATEYTLRDNPALALIYNEQGMINENVATALYIAGNQYVVNSGDMIGRYKSNEDIARMLGKHESEVDREAANILRDKGTYKRSVANGIGKETMQLLGLKASSSVTPEEYSKLLATLGQIGILMQVNSGRMEITNVPASVVSKIMGVGDESADDKTTVAFVRYSKEFAEERDSRAGIKEGLTALEKEVAIVDSIKKGPQFTAPTTKHKGKAKDLLGLSQSKDVRAALDATIATKFVLTNAIRTLADMDRDQALKYMGHANDAALDEMGYDSRESAIAANMELEAAYDELVALYDDPRSKGGVYFDWFQGSNDRIYMDSNTVKPQTEKHLHRWLVVPDKITQEVVDMNNGQHMQVVQYALAQAFGAKVDKDSTNKVLVIGDAILHMDANELTKRLKEGELGTVTVGDAEVELDVEHLGHVLQSIEFIRAYQTAKAEGKTTVNNTGLTVETDAVTSGFAHKLLQLPILGSTQEKWMEKTGLSTAKDVNVDEVSMNDILANGLLDSYQTLGSDVVVTEWADMQAIRDDKGFNRKYKAASKMNKAGWDVIKGILPSVSEDGKVSKELRDIFKPVFMTFQYAAGMVSIRNAMTTVMVQKMVDGMVSGKYQTLLNHLQAIGVKDVVNSKGLQKLLMEKSASSIRLNNGTTVQDMLGVYVQASYGEQVEGIMKNHFEAYEDANRIINTAFQRMFVVFKETYDKHTKGKHMTEADKLEVYGKLLDKFPIIKGPLSAALNEGVAIYKRSNKRSDGALEAGHTTIVKSAVPDSIKELYAELSDSKSTIKLTVQSMVKQLEAAVNAGAVVPIHAIDAATMVKTILDNTKRNGGNGILTVHDAIVSGITDMHSTVRDYNKNTVEVNKQYSIANEVLDMVNRGMEALEGEDKDIGDTAISVRVKGEKAPVTMSLRQAMVEAQSEVAGLATQVNKGRDELFSKSITATHMAALPGTAYSNGKEGTNTKNGTIQKDDREVVTKTSKVKNNVAQAIQDSIGCKA